MQRQYEQSASRRSEGLQSLDETKNQHTRSGVVRHSLTGRRFKGPRTADLAVSSGWLAKPKNSPPIGNMLQIAACNGEGLIGETPGTAESRPMIRTCGR